LSKDYQLVGHSKLQLDSDYLTGDSSIFFIKFGLFEGFSQGSTDFNGFCISFALSRVSFYQGEGLLIFPWSLFKAF